MNNSPNSSSPRHCYQMIRELGRNRAGGCITYLASDNTTQQLVVIKRYIFAQSNCDWSSFKAYQPEVQVLHGLDHPGIPHYLNSFETRTGFCMVQEYKNAESLAVASSWVCDRIKHIAISVLEILVYLQNRIPAVIHRAIKPENILVDKQLNVYLVDFSFAQVDARKVAMSSVAPETLGFMAPEQLYKRQLSEPTDLYGLGVTLICLLTGTKSMAIETLMDQDRRINFKPRLPQLNLRFLDWLEKMVAPQPKDRFPNASAAWEALKPIDISPLSDTVGELLTISRKPGVVVDTGGKIDEGMNSQKPSIPEVKFSKLILEFKTKNLGEKLTQTVTVSNSVPETLLEGHWKVAPHESDPPYIPNSHVWISFEPVNFKGNYVPCHITVDTSRLMTDTSYSRKILLHTNSSPEPYTLIIRVNTTPFKAPKLPYISLAVLFAIAWLSTGFGARLIAWFVSIASTVRADVPWVLTVAGFVAGFLAGVFLTAVVIKAVTVVKIALRVIVCLSIFVCFLAILLASAVLFWARFLVMLLPASCTALMACAGLLVGLVTGIVIKNHKNREFSQNFSLAIPLLSAGFSMSLSTGLNVGFNLFLILAAMGTGISLAVIIFYPHWQRKKILADYRNAARKRRLIK